MVPGMQVGLFFLRAAARGIISLGPHCHRAFIFLVSQRLRPRKGVDTAIPSCYFSTAEKFLHSHHARRHGKPAPWRSLRRRSSSPKASVNIVKDSPVSSLPFATRGLPPATSFASLRSSLPTVN